jgi:hypothetical protein
MNTLYIQKGLAYCRLPHGHQRRHGWDEYDESEPVTKTLQLETVLLVRGEPL